MVEEREYVTCIECGTPVVRVRDGENVTVIHSNPDSEPALRCVLNPAALPQLRSRG